MCQLNGNLIEQAWKGLFSNDHLENEFFFISQLFERNWEPRHYEFRWAYD